MAFLLDFSHEVVNEALSCAEFQKDLSLFGGCLPFTWFLEESDIQTIFSDVVRKLLDLRLRPTFDAF